MRKQPIIHVVIFLAVSIIIFSCQKEITTENEKQVTINDEPAAARSDHSKKIYASNIAELYAAVNDVENAGNTIVLAPGTYMLNASYPKAGRLELLNNMSITGQPGHPELVVIDASELPLTSFTIAGTTSRTGAVRMGDGSNAIEWITFQNDPVHTIRSLIQTDITATPTTKIKVAHCIIKGSSIGISILNRDPVANGRILEADIADNEIMDNTVPQFGSGIQIQNTLVENATLKVRLSRNHIHDNKSGMLIFNSSAQNSVVEVKSYNDNIENNGIGMVLNGGFILNASVPTFQNKLVFEAHSSTIQNNNGIPAPPFSFPAVGVHAAAGQAMQPFDLPGTARHNQLDASFYACDISGNGGSSQINAYGGHSFHLSSMPAGTYNTTKINLHGLRKNVTVNSINSVPAEPAGTNTVSISR